MKTKETRSDLASDCIKLFRRYNGVSPNSHGIPSLSLLQQIKAKLFILEKIETEASIFLKENPSYGFDTQTQDSER